MLCSRRVGNGRDLAMGLADAALWVIAGLAAPVLLGLGDSSLSVSQFVASFAVTVVVAFGIGRTCGLYSPRWTIGEPRDIAAAATGVLAGFGALLISFGMFGHSATARAAVATSILVLTATTLLRSA
jgi:FlaA1/EpsC-like NDP-sugar epimerase